MEQERKRVGILNKGENNRFIDNTFEGLDVGIQDEGVGTFASGNRFGGYAQDIKNLPLWLQYLVAFLAIVATIATVCATWFGYLTLKNQGVSPVVADTVATSTPNISDIFSRAREMDRDIDRQSFIQGYVGVRIFAKGSLSNVSGSPGYSNSYYLHITVAGGNIVCGFDNVSDELKRRIDLLKIGSKISVVGNFQNSNFNGGNNWYVTECGFTD